MDFIRAAVARMFDLALADNVHAIALPAIGAGLGGLNWDDVKAVLADISDSYPEVDLYVVEKYSPNGL